MQTKVLSVAGVLCCQDCQEACLGPAMDIVLHRTSVINGLMLNSSLVEMTKLFASSNILPPKMYVKYVYQITHWIYTHTEDYLQSWA